jgi:ADP-ribose pyrophosphatase YjhB (NUDIX family)
MIKKARAIIVKNKKVLLVTEDGDTYLLPGGHQETNETNEKTLMRELKEELDLSLKSMKRLWAFEYINKENKRKQTHYYLCVVEGEPKPDNKEIIGYLWCNFKECRKFYRNRIEELENIFEALHKQGII